MIVPQRNGTHKVMNAIPKGWDSQDFFLTRSLYPSFLGRSWRTEKCTGFFRHQSTLPTLVASLASNLPQAIAAGHRVPGHRCAIGRI